MGTGETALMRVLVRCDLLGIATGLSGRAMQADHMVSGEADNLDASLGAVEKRCVSRQQRRNRG